MNNRLYIKNKLVNIDKEINNIKGNLSDIVDVIKDGYPHIAAMILTVDDTLDVIRENFIDALLKKF